LQYNKLQINIKITRKEIDKNTSPLSWEIDKKSQNAGSILALNH
jgi:hypothetical protein